jgi:hypothetical protein
VYLKKDDDLIRGNESSMKGTDIPKVDIIIRFFKALSSSFFYITIKTHVFYPIPLKEGIHEYFRRFLYPSGMSLHRRVCCRLYFIKSTGISNYAGILRICTSRHDHSRMPGQAGLGWRMADKLAWHGRKP